MERKPIQRRAGTSSGSDIGGPDPRSGGSSLGGLVRQLADKKTLEHSWQGLEELLAAEGVERLRLLGFGSLVNADSAAATLAEDAARGGTAVMAYGARRVFDYRMDGANSRYLLPEAPDARALLNTRVTGDPADRLNGVLLETPLGDLAALREREADYSLARVAFRPWGMEEVGSAWILTCEPGTRAGRRRIRMNLTPNPCYYQVCREGAASFGPEFLQTWLDTTFLADGATRVADWERTDWNAS